MLIYLFFFSKTNAFEQHGKEVLEMIYINCVGIVVYDGGGGGCVMNCELRNVVVVVFILCCLWWWWFV